MDQAKNEFSAFLDWRKNERETEVKHLFEKMLSWRDESYRQISDIVHSNNKSVDKAYNDLLEVVFKLQNQVSDLRKEKSSLIDTIDNSTATNSQKIEDLRAEISTLRRERSVLLETVQSLNGDRRQMTAESPLEPSEALDYLRARAQIEITNIKGEEATE